MVAKFKGRTNCEQIYIKEIVFRTSDALVIELNRNITEYVVENGQFKMSWTGCYINGARGHDFTVPAKTFKDAQLIEIRTNENTPRKYSIEIDSWTMSDS